MPSGTPTSRSNDARLTLRTLGAGAQLCSADPALADQPLLEIGKPLALIAYLSSLPGRIARREHLVDMLWADLEPDAARHALRQTLWLVRRKVGDDVLTTAGDAVVLASYVHIDRDSLLAAVERGDTLHVVELYRGDFLLGFAAPGGAELERWADLERVRLRAQFLRAGQVVIRDWLTKGRFRDAQALARRMRDQNRLHEPSWRLLLETLIAGSDVVGATVEADALEQVLRHEEEEPEPATRALLRIVRQPASPKTSAAETGHSLVAELVGREREFSSVLEAWERASRGRASHLHVSGAAGYGKSRLLADVHARLRASGARAIMVRGNMGQRNVAFALAGDLVAKLARAPGARGVSPASAATLVAMNPTLSSMFEAPADPAHGFEALRRRILATSELLHAVAEENAVALLVDDVHWADADSRALLRGVVENIDRRRVLFVTAGRPVADADVGNERSNAIKLAPLTTDATGALVTSIAELPREAWGLELPTALRQATGGSPLLVLETLQLLMDRGLLARIETAWTTYDGNALLGLVREGSALARRVARLDRADWWLLVLLAVAGVPCSADLLADAAERPVVETSSRLESLEVRGFVSRIGGEWLATHDEVAAAAIRHAGDDARRRAEARIGNAVWHRAGADMAALRRAAVSLHRGADPRTLRACYARFSRLVRADGDRRSHLEVAHDLLGGTASPAVERGLVRSLALHWRLGLYTPLRQMAALAAVTIAPALALGTTAALRSAPPPDAELVVFDMSPTRGTLAYRVPVRARDWTPSTPLHIDQARNARWTFAAGHILAEPLQQPAGDAWLYARPVADSGAVDLFAMDLRGHEHRLTATRGDDQKPMWSPDGKQLVFETSRWDSLSHYDLAVMEFATGRVRRLTHGPETDFMARWSPDGTRIAFLRRYWETDSIRLCFISQEAQDPECSTRAYDRSTNLSGWVDDEQVLLALTDSDRQRLQLVRADGSWKDLAASVPGFHPLLSPDGRWLLCTCQGLGQSAGRLMLVPLARPADARTVITSVTADSTDLRLGWLPPRSSPYLDTLSIEVGNGSPIAGVPHLLRVRGLDNHGLPVDVHVARWSVSDSSAATIDTHEGLLTAKRSGTIRVTVSAGGWRQRTVTLTVQPAVDTVVAAEQWEDDANRRWRSFGYPAPAIEIDSAGHRVFANRGDGSFSSGAYSRVMYPTNQGLALDASVSAPITRTQWQTLLLGFISPDEGTSSDRAIGSFPLPDMEHCVGVVGGEGVDARNTLALGGALGAVRTPAPSGVTSGRWFRARVQLFPDGRCGLAIDGVPLASSQEATLVAPRVRIAAFGSSSGTRILVGPMAIRRGVPSDVDWRHLVVARPAPGMEAVARSRGLVVR